MTPPGSAPDEASHFVRVGGLAGGHPLGTPPTAEQFPITGFAPAQADRIRAESGRLSVDADYLYIVQGDCNAARPTEPACAEPPQVALDADSVQVSLHARSQVAGYVVPAALSVIGWSGRTTFYLARLGVAIACTVLLCLGLAAVGRVDRSRRARRNTMVVAAGLVAGYTPLAVFLSGVLAPSAVGIAGAAAMTMATWAVFSQPAPSRLDRFTWLVTVVAAAASQTLGVLFATLALVLGVAAAGGGWRRWRDALGLPTATIGAVVGVLSSAWDVLLRSGPPDGGLPRVADLVTDLSNTWTVTLQAADHLGWLDVQVPTAVTALAVVMFGWFVAVGLFVGDRRWAITLVGAAAAIVAIGIALTESQRASGFGLQARYLLPGLVVLPLASALRIVSLDVEPSRLRPRLVVGTWLASTLVAAWALVRRHVVGADGPIWFVGRGEFRPLGGWPLAAGLVTVLLLAVGVASLPCGHADTDSSEPTNAVLDNLST